MRPSETQGGRFNLTAQAPRSPGSAAHPPACPCQDKAGFILEAVRDLKAHGQGMMDQWGLDMNSECVERWTLPVRPWGLDMGSESVGWWAKWGGGGEGGLVPTLLPAMGQKHASTVRAYCSPSLHRHCAGQLMNVDARVLPQPVLAYSNPAAFDVGTKGAWWVAAALCCARMCVCVCARVCVFICHVGLGHVGLDVGVPASGCDQG